MENNPIVSEDILLKTLDPFIGKTVDKDLQKDITIVTQASIIEQLLKHIDKLTEMKGIGYEKK